MTIVAGAIVDPTHAEPTVRFFTNSATSVWGTVLSTWADCNARLGSAATRLIEVAAIDQTHKRDAANSRCVASMTSLNLPERMNELSDGGIPPFDATREGGRGSISEIPDHTV